MPRMNRDASEARAYKPHTELRVGFFDDDTEDNGLVIK